MLARFAGWPAEARDLLSRPDSYRRWALCTVDPDGIWAHGRIVLIGDAAHAMLPFAAQGGAMAIEDAAVLAMELARHAPAEAIAAYVAARRPRVAAVAALARRNGRIYHLSGPAAAARNTALRLMGGRRLLGMMDGIYGWKAG
ncbi:FAD-dependent monooxygenase [Methylobrevis pamukkalensis]|uniref:3-hydroxybenzoate 6-hydroxylase 1 n=1 Tax=Methylobrevis pamukkalensis TaxID=1439726 RepID=A0A1E3H131_9HYPH|nr:FAD-dependent monooxygenase [Methylobrevis pamukkalensis]ODN69526.1 3-hydroxybenzoate 6-hydroxylase 1 [Methylobrevis pamukkalensis]